MTNWAIIMTHSHTIPLPFLCMKKAFKKSEYFLAAVLALVAGFPLAVEPPAFHADVAYGASVVTATTIQQKALDNYQNYRDNRRDYQKSQELCGQLHKNGKNITCPSINDEAGILHFLATHEVLPPPATASGLVIQSLSDLNSYQLNLMRWYQKVNVCPASMKDFAPGFYELCQSLLNPHPPVLQSPSHYFNTATVQTGATLNDIIKANKGVKRSW